MRELEQAREQQGDETAPYSGFSLARRRVIIGLVSTAGFFGPLAGGIYLPALPVLQNEFGVDGIAINATVAVFMAVCAFAGLFWSSFADWKGRRPLYIIALAIYLVANVLMGTLPANFGALVFLRMVQAFGCSSVMTLGGGTVADITEPAKRATVMSVFLMGPSLGPTLGPVLGGIITGQASWRWSFHVLAIAVGIMWILIVFTLPETLRFRVGDGSLYTGSIFILPPRLVSPLAAESDRGPRPPKPSLRTFWRLFCYPPISLSSLCSALLFSTYFSVAVTLPDTLTSKYQWSVTAVGGGYLALGVAIVSGSLLMGRLSDWRRARIAKSSPHGRVAPESRLVDQLSGAILCGAGSIMYGWLVENAIHPAAVLVATFLVGIGMSSVTVVTFAFLTECSPQSSSSAMALEGMMRNPAAAIASVVTPSLVAKMGYGWYFTSYALLDLLVFGGVASSLTLYGHRWRAKTAATASSGSEISGTSSPKQDEKAT